MKKSKKIILGSEACLLAMASFGCVYGPPPDEDVLKPPMKDISVTENTDTEDTEQDSDWDE